MYLPYVSSLHPLPALPDFLPDDSKGNRYVHIKRQIPPRRQKTLFCDMYDTTLRLQSWNQMNRIPPSCLQIGDIALIETYIRQRSTRSGNTTIYFELHRIAQLFGRPGIITEGP